MKLYDVALSSNCKKVRICLAELGLQAEVVRIDPRAGDNRTPEYLAKNPMGKVPTIEDDGFVLWESGAILQYLAATHPDKRLYPADARGQADTTRWILWAACHVSPPLSAISMERLIKPMMGQPGNDERRIADAEKELARFLPVLDQQLEAREYVTGQYTIADIALGCTLEVAAMVKLDLEPYPRIRAWLDRLHAREAWKKSAGPALR